MDLKYNAASNAELTMQNGGSGDAGDVYTGLDRFGRLVETIWKTASAELVHTTYGRNRVGGVTWQRNVLAHAMSPTTAENTRQDNFYWHDNLQQNYQHQRGDLAGTAPNYTGITNLQQTEVRSFGYDAFGPVRFTDGGFVTHSTSTTDWNFLFHAEFLDNESGLYNYGYRFYNPYLGRWLSRDPIGQRGGLNRYCMLSNSPANGIDLLGLALSSTNIGGITGPTRRPATPISPQESSLYVLAYCPLTADIPDPYLPDPIPDPPTEPSLFWLCCDGVSYPRMTPDDCCVGKLALRD